MATPARRKVRGAMPEASRPGFVLTPGQAHDVQGFAPLFRIITDRIEAFLADRGYDANAIREEIASAGVEAVIPARRGRRYPAIHDRQKYKLRNLVERLFNKLKNWRRVVTRYDKTASSYLGFVARASIKPWIPFVHETWRRPICLQEPLESGQNGIFVSNWIQTLAKSSAGLRKSLCNKVQP